MNHADIPLKGQLSKAKKPQPDYKDQRRYKGRRITVPLDLPRAVKFQRCPTCGRLMSHLPCCLCQLEKDDD